MKPTEFIIETSLIAQEADVMHQDHEVQMARADCYNAAKYAIELHRMLKEMSESQGLEGWVSEKITLANDYLRTVAEYLRHEQAHNEDLMVFAEDAAAYALDSLLNEGNRDTRKKISKYKELAEDEAGVIGTGQGYMRTSKSLTSTDADDQYSHRFAKVTGTPQGTNVQSGDLGNTSDDYEPTNRTLPSNVKVKMVPQAGQANLDEGRAKKKSVKENASAGASGAAGIAVSMSGSGKPGTGKPKKIGNAAKMKKVQVGKGVY